MIKIPDIEIYGPAMFVIDDLMRQVMELVWKELITQIDEEGCGPLFAFLFYGNGEKQ